MPSVGRFVPPPASCGRSALGASLRLQLPPDVLAEGGRVGGSAPGVNGIEDTQDAARHGLGDAGDPSGSAGS